MIKKIDDHTGHIIGVSFSADGRWLASTSAGKSDRTVRIWETENWSETARAEQPSHSNAMYVAFSPDSKTVVASGYKAGIRVYDFDEKSLTLRYERSHRPEEMVPHVVFSPQGDHFITSSWDKTLACWQTSTGELNWQVSAPDYAQCFEAACFDSKHQIVYCVTRDETIQKRDTRTGELISSIRWNDQTRGLALSPNGKQLATAGHFRVIKLWEAF